MLLCFIICLIYRRRLHETPDLQASFLPFESLKGFFTEQSDDKGMRVKLTIYRIAFLWIAALIIVAQGGRGGCWRVAPKGGDAAGAAAAETQSETQHPDRISGALPPALVEALNDDVISRNFHFSNLRVDLSKDSDDDSPAESLTRTPEPFSVYSHLWLATIFVSPMGGRRGAAVHLYVCCHLHNVQVIQRRVPSAASAASGATRVPGPPPQHRSAASSVTPGRWLDRSSASESTPRAGSSGLAARASPVTASAAVPVASESGVTAVEVQHRLARASRHMQKLGGVTKDTVIALVSKVRRDEMEIDAVIAGIAEWRDEEGQLLVPEGAAVDVVGYLVQLEC